MDVFESIYHEYLREFGEGRKMVLSTSKDNTVSSRMMSVVMIEGFYYFQTDVHFRKYEQLAANPKCALCIDNIQIEGVAKELGRPMDHPVYIEKFRKIYPGSYDAYSALENERLFVVEPQMIERWKYMEGEAFIENFDIKKKRYVIEKYNTK